MTSLRKKKISGKIYWYAVRNARVDGKPRTVWQRYLGTADHVVDVFEGFGNLDITLKTYDFGGIAAMLALAEDLGFRDIVTAVTGDEEAWKHFLLMVSGRFNKARSGRPSCPCTGLVSNPLNRRCSAIWTSSPMR